jgi:hypothetical protein
MTGSRVLTVGGAAVGPHLAGVTIGTTPEGLSVFREARPAFDKTRSLTVIAKVGFRREGPCDGERDGSRKRRTE